MSNDANLADDTPADDKPKLEAVPEPKRSLDIAAFLDDMELGEIADLEDATDQPIAQLLRQFETNNFTASSLIGITWLILRRDDPDATLEDARKVKLTELAGDTDDDDEDDSDPKDE